jgi:predicted DNA-binding transcriptional regulator YafY
MARSSEVVRQWEILRGIDGARHGIAIAKLAAEHGVHQRTIRRDLDALGRAGFPLYDEKVNGTSMWKLRAKPFRSLEELGLTMTELCALYFSHSMLRALAGTPLTNDADHALLKIERALPAGCRKFLDQLPRVLTTKSTGRKKGDDRRLHDILARVLDATLLHRRASMRYASASSGRTKEYIVEPQRIAYAGGGIYLIAWVPEYRELRTFAAERIASFALLDDHFQPRPLPSEPFACSLGVHSGAAERIVIEFEPDVAPYVRDREWHSSQAITDRDDGGIVLTMDVCNDLPLRTWILGFGPSARVIAPVSLQEAVFEAADGMRRRYLRALTKAKIEMLSMRAS